jgi:hypothetical protein
MRLVITGLVAAAMAVAAFWAYSSRVKWHDRKAEPTPIADGATLNPSGGNAVSGPSASDKAVTSRAEPAPIADGATINPSGGNAVSGTSASKAVTFKAEPTPIVDGATIDFSGGKAVVGTSASDKAAIDSAVRQIDDAVKSVTFPADPAQKK